MYDIKDFEISLHAPQVLSWLSKRQRGTVSSFPKTGKIVEDQAVGFLSYTDTDTAFLCGAVTNPDAAPSERKEAMNHIAISLIDIAKEKGYRFIRFDTSLQAVEETLSTIGFNCIGTFKSFLKEI